MSEKSKNKNSPSFFGGPRSAKKRVRERGVVVFGQGVELGQGWRLKRSYKNILLKNYENIEDKNRPGEIFQNFSALKHSELASHTHFISRH